MKKYFKNIDLAAFLTTIYLCLVLCAYLYLNIRQISSIVLMKGIGVIIIAYFLVKFIMDKLRNIEFSENKKATKMNKLLVFVATVIVVILVMMIWLLAYFPGSFSPDSIRQYGQAIGGTYDDWHPVWHTLVFFTFPLKLFGTPASIIIMQIVYFSLILGYMSMTIFQLVSLKASILSIAYIILNPYTCYILLYPWKDVGFAMGVLLCSVFSVRLIYKIESTEKLWKIILFGFGIASVTIFRHNAILFTAPLLLVLFINVDRKTCVKTFLFSVIFLFVIKVPIYQALGVEKAGKRVVEVTGLPLTVIGNVVKETPDKMDEELSGFVYSIASPEEWQEYYKCGEFNRIKWTGVDTSAVEEQGYIGMIKLMIKCFKLSPQASFRAFFALTDMVYGFDTGLEGNIGAYIEDNPYGIEYSDLRNVRCMEYVSNYSEFIDNSIFKYLRTYGICLFVLLVVFLSKLDFKSWVSWKKVLMIAPIYVYDFGTMLLLTGADSRFFFVTFLVTPLLIVYALCNKKI